MIQQLQAQATCFPAIKFKPYSIWDDVFFILMVVSILVLYTGCTYFLMQWLKLITNTLKKYFKKENC
ncbi:hypothetical protein DBR28_06505 [Chryseobacterium sp. HMWF028]|nr:hypothetical protein DBR28_06505 [Chryseobacterium sp. HMWF028]